MAIEPFVEYCRNKWRTENFSVRQLYTDLLASIYLERINNNKKIVVVIAIIDHTKYFFVVD
jgi:hypothetical protein